MVMQRNDRKSPRLGIRQRNEILRIYALEDQAIVAGRRSETMAVDVRRTVLAVQPDVVERRAIVHPDRGSHRVDDDVGEVGAGREITHVHGVELRAGLVRGPCEQPVIRRVAASPELEEGPALCQGICVEQNLGSSSSAGLSADQGVLPALAIALEIGERTVGSRNRSVVLLDPPLHLGKHRVLQGVDIRQACGRVRIFGVEIRADVRIKRRRIAHHLLPIARL